MIVGSEKPKTSGQLTQKLITGLQRVTPLPCSGIFRYAKKIKNKKKLEYLEYLSLALVLRVFKGRERDILRKNSPTKHLNIILRNSALKKCKAVTRFNPLLSFC